MDPITVSVEKKATESLWGFLRDMFTRKLELINQVEDLRAQLNEERTGSLAFERALSELECHPEDDNIYERKDGSGMKYCPLCIHEHKRLIPLAHGVPGVFRCQIHNECFETKRHRERIRTYRPRFRTWSQMRSYLERTTRNH